MIMHSFSQGFDTVLPSYSQLQVFSPCKNLCIKKCVPCTHNKYSEKTVRNERDLLMLAGKAG